jgi:hypothetical protein
MKNIKNSYDYGKIRVIGTQNTLSMYSRDYNNGFISAVVDNARNRVEFSIFSDNCLSSHSKFIINEYVPEIDMFWDIEDLYNITINCFEYIHPLDVDCFDNMIKCQNNIDNTIINLVKFARYNELNLFINDIDIDKHPDLKQFIFGDTYSISVANIKTKMGKLGLGRFKRILDDCLPSYIPIEYDTVKYLYYSNDSKQILLPVSIWNAINSHPYMDDIEKIAIGTEKCTPMLFGYNECMARCVYTVDGIYTNNYFNDFMIEEYLSYQVNNFNLYYNENGGCHTMAYFCSNNNEDYVSNCDYIWVENEECYYHEDCVWYDDRMCEYRLDSDRDIEYIHSYKSSDRDLNLPEKFITGTKFQCGLEVEVEFDYDREDTAEFLVENHSKDESNFILEEDGSLSDGFEMVTSPFIFNGELPNWLSKSLDYIENDTDRHFKHCGGHIHIDRNSFVNRESIQLFTYLFNEYDVYIAKISGRDDISPDYAQSQKGAFESVLDVHTTGNNWCSRYVYVNRQNARTVEVRIFKGCTDKDIIVKRLNLLKNMVEYCNNFVENNVDVLDNMSIINGISWYDFSGLDSKGIREFNGEYYN